MKIVFLQRSMVIIAKEVRDEGQGGCSVVGSLPQKGECSYGRKGTMTTIRERNICHRGRPGDSFEGKSGHWRQEICTCERVAVRTLV